MSSLKTHAMFRPFGTYKRPGGIILSTNIQSQRDCPVRDKSLEDKNIVGFQINSVRDEIFCPDTTDLILSL